MSRIAFIIILSVLASCNPYREVLEPLKHIPPDCYCRYATMAKHYYDCRKAELLEIYDFPRKIAKDSAVILTNEFIAETQLNIKERDRKKMCNCFELRRRYGTAAVN